MIKRPLWMLKKGITWPDLIKIGGSMGLLLFLVIIMTIGAVGAML